MRVIITGAGRSEKSKNAAVSSIRPAWTPGFSATVMLTTDNGERRAHWQVCLVTVTLTILSAGFQALGQGLLGLQRPPTC